MSETAAPPPGGPQPGAPQTPRIQKRRAFPVVWIIPVVAAFIAAWLVWRTLSQEGPVISITFNTADGLVAGQTKVRHKAVDLGTVASISLTPNMGKVVVRVRMRREATPALTDHAAFWVVRPRFTGGSISGLETLVSGAFIEFDPGGPGGTPAREFKGLEQPPVVRADEPGHSYVLQTTQVGSLGIGSPVLYRDVVVGEVVRVNPGNPGQPGQIVVFVREPYDKDVHQGTYFWNDSGLAISAGAEGLRVELHSLQALISGAVGFATPPDARVSPRAPDGSQFTLYPSQKAAAASHFREKISFVVHFHGSVRGLAVGAPVDLFGITVGEVQSVQLHYDPAPRAFDVAVRVMVQPERMFAGGAQMSLPEAEAATEALVRQGLHAQLETANFLTGQLLVALEIPNGGSTPARVMRDGSDLVVPGESGGLDNLSGMLTQIAAKLNALPLDQVVANLNHTLRGLDAVTQGPELKQILRSAAAAMTTTQALVRKLDEGATPALRRLPDISASLQSTVQRASRLVASVQTDYGDNSEFGRQLQRMMAQLTQTARSISTLASLLDQHPEALLLGRTRSVTER